MFIVCFAVLGVVTGGTLAGYAGSTASSGNELGHDSNSDNGYGYGFSGSYNGNGPPPNFAFPPFDFGGFLGNYLESLSRYHQEFLKKGGGAFSYSHTSASPTAIAKSQSSLTFNRKGNNRLQANTIGASHGGYGQPGGFSGGYGGSFGGGDAGAFGGSYSGPDGGSFSSYPAVSDGGSYGGSFGGGASGGAAASASFGPGGIHQTAGVYPENPISPNINTRFGGSSSGGPGFHSVFTSSQSRTANVDGKPVTLQQATTTVNDNGKVTTYTAKNP